MTKDTKILKSKSFNEINSLVKAFVRSRPGEDWTFTITANFLNGEYGTFYTAELTKTKAVL